MACCDLKFTLKQSSIWSLDICSAGKSVCKVSDLKETPSSFRDGYPVLIISNSTFYKWVGESPEDGSWVLSPSGKDKFYYFNLISNDSENERFEVYQINPCYPAKRFDGDKGLSKGDLLIVSCENTCNLYSYDHGWVMKSPLSV